MSQYFVKRGEKIHGPFSESQLRSGLKSKKLSGKDLASKQKSGPWRKIADEISNSAHASQNNAGDNILFENQRLKLTQSRLTILQTASSYQRATWWVFTESRCRISVDPHSIASVDLAEDIKRIPEDGRDRQLTITCIWIALAPPILTGGMVFVSMLGSIASNDFPDLSFLFTSFGVSVVVMILFLFTASYFGKRFAKLETIVHVMKLNFDDGKHSEILFDKKSEATAVYNLLESFL